MDKIYQSIQRYLDAVVPLKILAYQESGGPQRADFARCAMLIDRLHDAVPATLTDGQIRALAVGIAILAFVPGGIELFGRHWQAQSMDGGD